MSDKTDFRETRGVDMVDKDDKSLTDDLDAGTMEAFLHRVLCAIIRKYGELEISQSSILAEPGELSLTPSTDENDETHYTIKEGIYEVADD